MRAQRFQNAKWQIAQSKSWNLHLGQLMHQIAHPDSWQYFLLGVLCEITDLRDLLVNWHAV